MKDHVQVMGPKVVGDNWYVTEAHGPCSDGCCDDEVVYWLNCKKRPKWLKNDEWEDPEGKKWGWSWECAAEVYDEKLALELCRYLNNKENGQ